MISRRVFVVAPVVMSVAMLGGAQAPRPIPESPAQLQRPSRAPTSRSPGGEIHALTVSESQAGSEVPAIISGNLLTTVEPSEACYFMSIAIGTDGLPVISYLDSRNDALKVVHCGNTACSSGNTVTTVDRDFPPIEQSTSITIGADGLPVIAYGVAVLKVAHCGNAECTSGNVVTAVGGADTDGQGISIRIGADGLPVVSYYDGGDLKGAHCGNVACSAGNTLTTVDSAGDVGQYNSLAIGADGLPVISYYDGTYFGVGDLKVAHCGNAVCTSGNMVTTVDSGPWMGGSTSLAIGPDGLPVISYGDPGYSALKVAHCGNIDCTSGNTLTTVDPEGDARDTSITIGMDGLPVISYCDLYSALKVAHCGDAACTSGNTVATIDVGESVLKPPNWSNVGRWNSIVIGADGLPVITYYGGVDAGVKVAHCGTPSCTAFNVRRHLQKQGP